MLYLPIVYTLSLFFQDLISLVSGSSSSTTTESPSGKDLRSAYAKYLESVKDDFESNIVIPRKFPAYKEKVKKAVTFGAQQYCDKPEGFNMWPSAKLDAANRRRSQMKKKPKQSHHQKKSKGTSYYGSDYMSTSSSSYSSPDYEDDFGLEKSEAKIKPKAKKVTHSEMQFIPYTLPIETKRELFFPTIVSDEELVEEYTFQYDEFDDYQPCGEGYNEMCWNLSFFKSDVDNEVFLVHGLWAQDVLEEEGHMERPEIFTAIVANAIQISFELQQLVGIWFSPVTGSCNYEDMPYAMIADIWVYEFFKHGKNSNLNSDEYFNKDEFIEAAKYTKTLANAAGKLLMGEEHRFLILDSDFLKKFSLYIVNLKRALLLVKSSYEAEKFSLLKQCKDAGENEDCGVCITASMDKLMPCAPTERAGYSQLFL